MHNARTHSELLAQDVPVGSFWGGGGRGGGGGGRYTDLYRMKTIWGIRSCIFVR